MPVDLQLSPDQLRYAIDHALQLHALAEQERQRLATCTDVETLRATLHELELPAQDIEAALGSLAAALETPPSAASAGSNARWRSCCRRSRPRSVGLHHRRL